MGGAVTGVCIGCLLRLPRFLIEAGQLGVEVAILLVDIPRRRARHFAHAADDVGARFGCADGVVVLLPVLVEGGQITVESGQQGQFAHVVAAFQQVDGTEHIL